MKASRKRKLKILSLLSTGLGLVGLWCGAKAAASEISERPNILFIYTDDQSHRTLSCLIDGGKPQVVPGYSTDVYTDFAEKYINSKHDKPWFLWLCYNAPHLPNIVHPRHADEYAGVEVPIPPDVFGPRSGKPDWMQELDV